MAGYLCLQKAFSSLSKCSASCSGIPGPSPLWLGLDVFWNYFQTTLSCTAGVIWLGIGVTSSFPTISFGLAYANFKWKRMMLIVMLHPAACSHHLPLESSSFASYTMKYGNSPCLSFVITASSYKGTGRERSTPPAKQEEKPPMLT